LIAGKTVSLSLVARLTVFFVYAVGSAWVPVCSYAPSSFMSAHAGFAENGDTGQMTMVVRVMFGIQARTGRKPRTRERSRSGTYFTMQAKRRTWRSRRNSGS